MEVEFVTEGVSEGEPFAIDANTDDYSTFDGERCGICMDIVIDRGVLDCCQHWYMKYTSFCFSCIDNWATITSLCPLCQNEFQLITCVPVYDTIGSNNAEDDSHFRVDDWCIEGRNNTLTFPSYYIEEDAVICLEGDGCKVRSGSATIEEDSKLDTSIACDSCDKWYVMRYHAFCVGFDPEGTCENSWLCQRCVADELPQKSEGTPVMMSPNRLSPENASTERLAEAAFSGKMSVSVADAGETAVVVSLVEGSQRTGHLNGKMLSGLDACHDLDNDSVVCNFDANNHRFEAPSRVSVSVADAGETAIVVSMVEGNQMTEDPNGKFLVSFDGCKDVELEKFLSSSTVEECKLETTSSQGVSMEANFEAKELELSLSGVTSLTVPSNLLACADLRTSSDEKARKPSFFDGFGASKSLQSSESLESGLDLHLGLNVGPTLSDEQIIRDLKANVSVNTASKRKHRDWRDAEHGEPRAKIDAIVSSKKVKAKGKSQLIHSKNQADGVVPIDSKFSSLISVSKDDKLRCTSAKEKATTSIMDIVQGTDHRTHKRVPLINPADTSSRERENPSGLRVKKIMRRAIEDKESSVLVQKLRKEIRDAVRNKSSKEFGDNLFDPKLLAAFRAAVAGPLSESKRPSPLDLKAKKSLLQKGKIREGLTKKIYGIGGRRRRAWNRDCEIEFWKHRCSKTTKPEKIETLKSVLNLLRSSGNVEIKQGSEKGATSSILSRLYLADASVLPRKDNIKPVSALKATGIPEQAKGYPSRDTAFRPSSSNRSAKTPQTNVLSSQLSVPSIENEPTKITVPNIKVEAASSKAHPHKSAEGKAISPSAMVGKSDDRTIDKRKWALQVLARKTAVKGKSAAEEQHIDNTVFRGYPLLAQLPKDMLPILAPSRHNKIPISMRQAQLHRLTEHLLRKANLPVIRRTAETELAVADAVNIEREVADRSNSKLVYVNLCSQELPRRSDNNVPVISRENNPNPILAVPTDRLEEGTNEIPSGLEVDEALRNAGLLSDSPPDSPHHQMEEIKEEKEPMERIEEEEPDNVFELECQPDLDIYGDFEYDLEDEDLIGANAFKISKVESAESKMKMLFSTLDSDRLDGVPESEDHVDPRGMGVSKGSSCLSECQTDTNIRSSPLDKEENIQLDEGGEELSLAECEELYGPDKEPLIEKYPEKASIPNEVVTNEKVGSVEVSEVSEGQRENLGTTSVLHPSSGREVSPNQSRKEVPLKEKLSNGDSNKQSESYNSVHKKVEAYIKEHVRPLYKSGVITVEQYRWAVGKTTEKIMKYHSRDTNARFLIKEGEKVKRLVEQYVETAQQTGNR
ncbi:hypothetical protein RJ639_019385 [Escallonia herrerae]|uniref:RING-type domain-containing protein n=1 Tax=Escallonia herrerae TaxID=1293975 RepID=A0AA89AIH7_9ASTE|nr:hypothetical protein RJ639_019385 [Escallonia herrerae]